MRYRKTFLLAVAVAAAACATQKDVKQIESKVDVLSTKTVESKSALASTMDDVLEKQKKMESWEKDAESRFQLFLKNQADLRADITSLDMKLKTISGQEEESAHSMKKIGEKLSRMEERIKALNTSLMETQMAQGQQLTEIGNGMAESKKQQETLRQLGEDVGVLKKLLMDSQLLQGQQIMETRRDMQIALARLNLSVDRLGGGGKAEKPEPAGKGGKPDKSKAAKPEKGAKAENGKEDKKGEGEPPPVPAGAEELYGSAYRNFLKGDFAAAAKEFSEYVKRFSSEDLAGNSQYWLGEALANMGKSKEALDAFNLTAKNFPNSSKAPAALLRASEIARAGGDKAGARAFLEKIRDNYPASLEGATVDDKLKELAAHADKE